jgi:hypothetical protein
MTMLRKKPRQPPHEEIFGTWRSVSYGKKGSVAEVLDEELL